MSRKILIVEDEPNIVIPLRFSLERKGYVILVAESGEAALEMIPTEKPDLVLLDIMLPGIDGYEVCEKIRLDPDVRSTRIIFLSAMGRDIDIAKGMSLAADDYIIKPFSILEVIDKVGGLLGEKEKS
jgi:DNA-binding response OmpR family regulator